MQKKWNHLRDTRKFIREHAPVRIVDVEKGLPNLARSTVYDQIRQLEHIGDISKLKDGRLVPFDYEPLRMRMRKMVAVYRTMHNDPLYNPPLGAIASIFGRATDDPFLKAEYLEAIADQSLVVPAFLQMEVRRHHARLVKLANDKALAEPTVKDVANGLLRLGILFYNSSLKRRSDLLFEAWKTEVSHLTQPLYKQTSSAPFLKQMAEIVSEEY